MANMITGGNEGMTRYDWETVHQRLVDLYHARWSAAETAAIASRLPESVLPSWADAYAKYLESHGYRVDAEDVLRVFMGEEVEVRRAA